MSVEFTHPGGESFAIGQRELWVERDGSGEPLLLLGGFGPAGSHVIFHPHFDPFAEHFEVIYVDLFGRGRSGVPADLAEITFAADVADVRALLRRLDLGPVHLYGFSYGGLVAQALALEHPEAVRTITVANSLHSPQMWQLNHENLNRELANQFPEAWAQVQVARTQGKVSTDAAVRPLFAPVASIARFYNPDNAAAVASEPGDRALALYPVFVGDDVDFVVGGEVARLPDFRTRLRGLTVPMMVLGGRFDRALYPALQMEFAVHAPGCVVHILDRSGSFSHVEEPDTVLKYVLSFTGVP